MINITRSVRSLMLLLTMMLLTQVGWGQVTINSGTTSYTQNFNSLSATTGTAISWTNNSTIAGWYLFQAGGTAITQYSAETGSTGTATYCSYGSASGNTERAFGSTASGGGYWGSPASGATAGYMALSLKNSTGATITSITVSYDGEQWRNAGNTSSHSLTVQYGFGSSYATVSAWTNAPSGFTFTSPVTGSSAAAVAGNTTGKVSGLGGTISSLAWDDNSTIWIRWVDLNDSGNDHALAIDDLSISWSAPASAPEINIKQGSTSYATGDTYGFGNQVSGTSSSATTFTIENTGTATLNLTGSPNVSISGTNASEFSVTQPSSTSILASGNTTFTITFSPTSQGAKSAKISIANDDATGSENPYEINLTGTGTVSSLSDVAVTGGYVYTSNVDYASYQGSATLTTGNSVGVVGLTIRDGGASTDDDNLGTTLSAITISTGGSTAIRTAALFDGSTNVSEVAVNGATSISFTGLTLAASDGGTKDFELRVTYQSTVTDNQQLTFTVSNVTALSSGSGFAAANGGAAASSATGDINRIEVTVSQLVFGQQPSNVDVNAVMSPAVTVLAKDANSNTDLDFSDDVRISSTGTLTGSPVSVAASSGTATFSSLTHTSIGTGYNLTAERNNLGAWDLDVNSSTFDVRYASSASDYFRSVASVGDWSNVSSWESSPDNSNWYTATLSPTSSSASILVRNGHVITITSIVTIDQLIIQGGARVVVNSGFTTTVNNGSGDDILVQDGGQIDYKIGPSYSTGATIRINGGGILSIQATGLTGSGAGVNASTHLYDNNSILEWKLSTSTPSSSGVTYFPNVDANTIPIFRFSLSPQNSWGAGAGNNTTINGRLEIISGVTLNLQNAGTKIFRNGITLSGNGILNQSSAGPININGISAQINGTGTLNLGASGMNISSGSASITSGIQINSGTITVSGTLDMAGFVLSGTAGLMLTGTIKTAHADGITGSLTNSGTIALTGGTVDHTSASTQTIAAGTYGNVTNSTNGDRTLANGTIKIGGTFTPGSGLYTIGTSTVEFNGSSAQTIPVPAVASGSNYYNLVHSGTSTATLASSVSVANDFTSSGTNASSTIYVTDAESRTLTINGNLILTDGELDFAKTGSSVSGIIELKGNLTQTAGITYTEAAVQNGRISFSGSGTDGSPQTISVTSNNTFQYTNITVASGTVVQLNNSIIISGSGTANYIGTVNVNGKLNVGSNSITSSGANAAFNLNSGGVFVTASTTGLTGAVPSTNMTRVFDNAANYEFTGSTAISNPNFPNTTMNNLVISNTGGVTLGATISVDGNLTVASGAALLAGTRSINLKGNWTNNGTFTPGSGTLSLIGSTSQSFTHSLGSYNNVTLNNSAGGVLNSSIPVSGNLELTSGTLDLASNTLTYSGSSITSAGGSIDADVGAVTFTNTSSIALPSSVFAGSVKDITLNGSGGVTLGANQTVTGTLALTSGTLDLSDKTLTYSGSSITRTSGSIDVDAGGLIFNNTNALTLPVSTFNGNIKDLTMNGAGGVTLADNQTVTGALTLTSGKLSVGNNTLTVSGSVSGGNSGSYIQTNGTGKLVRNGIATSTLFPVGNAKYNPLTINNPDNLNWSVNVKDGITPDPGFPATGRVDLIWDITPSTTPTPSSTTITFQFDENTQVGTSYSAGTPLQAFRRNRYDEYWQPVGAPELRLGTAPANTVTISGLTNFSKYALSNVGSPLPVSLLSFSGYKDGTRNQLRWVTASETNNSGFEVQRSSDGLSYSSLGFVSSLAIGGNSQSQLKYSFIDANPTGLKHYYRLKQMDIDGRSTFSNILLIQGEKPVALEIASVYPNPSRGQVTILLNAPENKAVTIRLIDLAGRVLQTKQINALAGNNSIPFDISNLAKGQYLISVGEKSVKVVKE